jgi:predicted dehydrogenase
MRFHPGPAMVRRLLQDGAIGSLLSYRVHTGSYLPHWRPAQDYRKSYSASIEHGGAILDCIHELDLALWYAGPGKLLAAKSVPARSIDLQTEGLAEILIEHDSGALGSVHLNFMERDYRRSCVCIGSEGTIEWNFSESAVLEYRPEPGKIVRHPLAEDWQINTMYVDEIRYFLTCALQNKPTFNSIQDNLGCLKLALEAKSRA